MEKVVTILMISSILFAFFLGVYKERSKHHVVQNVKAEETTYHLSVEIMHWKKVK